MNRPQASDSGEDLWPLTYFTRARAAPRRPAESVSGLAGSARDLTWTAVLPSDGAVPVSAVGPTFWWGGTVTDPNPQALFGQGFLEVQFYPDAIVNTCSSSGGFNVTFAPDKFSVCSPVWQVTTTSGKENAAFNAELYNGSSKQPLVMNAGDTIKIHFFVASPGQGWNVTISDLTTGQSGTIVLNSKYGPMLPAFSTSRSATRWAGAWSTTRRTRSCGRSGTPRTSRPRLPGSASPDSP